MFGSNALKLRMRDLGFDCSQEAGFTKMWHGMRNIDKKKKERERKWDTGFS